MAGFFPKINLSIRKKVLIGFIISMIVVMIFTVVTYRNLILIERKVKFVVIGYELHDHLLEVRRYEKNYLLYGDIENYKKASSNLDAAKNIALALQPDIKNLKGAPRLADFQEEIESYSNSFDELLALEESKNFSIHQKHKIERQLRKTGKDLIDLSFSLANFHHTRIQKILITLKKHFSYMTIIYVILGILLTIFITRKIIKPLSLIEETTKKIARGAFYQIQTNKSENLSFIRKLVSTKS